MKKYILVIFSFFALIRPVSAIHTDLGGTGATLSQLLRESGTSVAESMKELCRHHFEINHALIKSIIQKDAAIKNVLVLGAGFGFDLPLEWLVEKIKQNELDSLTIVDGYIEKTNSDLAKLFETLEFTDQERAKITVIQADFTGCFRLLMERREDILSAMQQDSDSFLGTNPVDFERSHLRQFFTDNLPNLFRPEIKAGTLIISSLVFSQLPLTFWGDHQPSKWFEPLSFTSIYDQVVFPNAAAASFLRNTLNQVLAQAYTQLLVESGAEIIYFCDTVRTIKMAKIDMNKNGEIGAEPMFLELYKHMDQNYTMKPAPVQTQLGKGVWCYSAFIVKASILTKKEL